MERPTNSLEFSNGKKQQALMTALVDVREAFGFVSFLSAPLRLDLGEIQWCFVFVTSSTLTPDVQSKNKKSSRAASHVCSCHSNCDGSWPARTHHTGMESAQVRELDTQQRWLTFTSPIPGDQPPQALAHNKQTGDYFF